MIKHQCGETEPMISGYLDGELTQGDRQKVELILDECQTCQQNLKEMKQFRQHVGGITYTKMTESEKNRMSSEVTGSVGAGVGQLLVLGGFVVLYGSGIFYLLRDLIQNGEAPLFIRIGLPALFLGLGVLFFTVLLQRIRASKTDRYKNVRL
ncbi:MAG: hypothetical protein HOI66_18675 [Verrucomicrobia bacterium]|jgi:hypothetical protein|nr:hypothetical protein [Verrucomicrobiota bacterium]MDA7510740.1 hypothetical protein [Verrucomicrobiota bacterium]